MKLSLITIYRNREQHLRSQLVWWQQNATLLKDCEWIVIEADTMPSSGIKKMLQSQNIQYQFMENSGILHKTKALNLGLKLTQGKYVTPFDVDLIPVQKTLMKHLDLAEVSPKILVAGYRVMTSVESVLPNEIEGILEQSTIAPEDQPSALYKHLLKNERFGTLPFFERQRLLEIQGWDENFIGWGAEDQDLIERYLETSRYLCRSPHLVYLHLHHEPEFQWREETNIIANRQKYYQKQANSQRELGISNLNF